MVRGFGWGIGFCISLFIAYLVFDLFYETQEEVIERTGERIAESMANPVQLSPSEKAQILVSIERIADLNGKKRVIGKIENTNSFAVSSAYVHVDLLSDGVIAESCIINSQLDLTASESKEFVALCKEDWSQLNSNSFTAEANLLYAAR